MNCIVLLYFVSVEKVVIVVFIAALSTLLVVSTLVSALVSALSLVVASSLLRDLHVNITVGQSVEQEVGCQLLVLIAGDVCLGGFEFTES